MEELKSLSEVDSVVRKNPNTVLIVYKEGCPYCEKIKEEIKKLDGKINIALISSDKAAPFLSRVGAKGVPYIVSFKECEIANTFEGYIPGIADKIGELYADAKPVCKVDLSKVLFEQTNLGDPIIL